MSRERETFLENACEQVTYKPIRESLRKELDNHIEDRAFEYQAKGMEPEAAQRLAVSQMGDPAAIGIEFQKLHHKRFSWYIAGVFLVMGILSLLTRYYKNLMTVDGQSITDLRVFFVNVFSRIDLWLSFGVFVVTGLFGYYLIVKYKLLSAAIILGILPILAKLTGLGWCSWYRLVEIYPIASIPFLVMILYRYRANVKLACSMYVSGIAAVIIISLVSRPNDYTLIMMNVITCYIVLIVTCQRDWYPVSKKWMTGIATGIFAFILMVGMLALPYAKAEVKMLFGVNTQEKTMDSSPYDGIVIRDLLSQSKLFSGVSMTKQEMLAYRSAKYYKYQTKEIMDRIADENYEGMSLYSETSMRNEMFLELPDEESITVDTLLPTEADAFYPVARIIIKYGWWIGIMILLAIVTFFVYLFRICLHRKNRLAFLLSFSSCVFLSLQTLFALLREFGFPFSTPIEYPMLYWVLFINISDTFLLGLIFSAYRYDSVREQE